MTGERQRTEPILSVQGLKKHFGGERHLWGGASPKVYAVDGVDFTLNRGETLSVVGESGCGKSTVARAVLGLTDITEGRIELAGRRIDTLSIKKFRPLRKQLQVVFQDPMSSLNPRLRVRDILAEPIINFGLRKGREAIDQRIGELLDLVRLPKTAKERWPHQFSGGQRQRIGIARALAVDPEIIVCDESVSALDVSVQAQIINLLGDLQSELGLTLLFISHDLAVVEHLSHRVAVMYLGRIVEIGFKRELFAAPAHPYTEALLSAVPLPDPERKRLKIRLSGDVPSPIDPPQGCHFHTRCRYAFDRCRVEAPKLRPRSSDAHLAACHLDDLAASPLSVGPLHMADHKK